MRPALPGGLYGMADTSLGDPVWLATALAAGACRVVQLRAKSWTTAQRTAAATRLVALLGPLGVLVVINDDVDAALASGAHGVHLGQDDGPLATARRRLGPDALIGRSTHSLQQVDRACAEGADYVGFGPVWATATKAAAGPGLGLDSLARALTASRVPVVAIGGISLGRLPALRAHGLQHWAVVSDLLDSARLGAAQLSATAQLLS